MHFDTSIKLADNAMLRHSPELFDEWDFEKNDELGLDVYKITYGSSRTAWWVGKDCGHPWDTTPKERTVYNRGCPYCSGHRVLRGFNDMWTTNPELASMLGDPEDGYKYSQRSNQTVRWKCYSCSSPVKERVIDDVYGKKVYCINCSDGFSYPEKLVFNLLSEVASEEIIWQTTFSWSEGKIYDFYLPERSIIIEVHGEQHYKKPFYSNNPKELQKVQANDKLKRKLSLDSGIKEYVVIDAMITSYSYLVKSIKTSLKDIFDLECVDWSNLALKSSSSIKVQVLELWNSDTNLTVQDISEKLSISVDAIRKYLRDFESQGRCIYNSGRRDEVIGVFYDNTREKWAAKVQVKKKQIHLGFYGVYEDAVTARKAHDRRQIETKEE